MRRVIINGNLHFSEDNGYTSGGFIADSIVTGNMNFGTQQQFITRNIHWGGQSRGGAWNIVKVGCTGGTETVTPDKLSVVSSTPIAAPKPYVYVENQQWFVGVPKSSENSSGPTAFDNIISYRIASNFLIARNSAELGAANARIAKGWHVLVAPGIYELDSAIKVTRGTIVLGLGLATLLGAADGAIVAAGDPSGARVGGFLLEAMPATNTFLLDWSPAPNSSRSSKASYLYDIYCRVGGSHDPAKTVISIPAMVRIGYDHTVCDNFWLWVADHGTNIEPAKNCSPVTPEWSVVWDNMHAPTCLIVDGDFVTCYGLAAEHSTGGDLVVWNGNHGQVYFYQSEFPYHPPANYNQISFRGNGSGLTLIGAGAYTYFPCDNITVASGFALQPDAKASIFTRYLDGTGGVAAIDAKNCPGSRPVTKKDPGPYWCRIGL